MNERQILYFEGFSKQYTVLHTKLVANWDQDTAHVLNIICKDFDAVCSFVADSEEQYCDIEDYFKASILRSSQEIKNFFHHF